MAGFLGLAGGDSPTTGTRVVNATGCAESDFVGFVASRLGKPADEDAAHAGSTAIVAVDNELRNRMSVELGARCPERALKGVRIVTPAMLAQTLLQHLGGRHARLVTTGELRLVFEALSNQGVAARDAVKALDARAASLARTMGTEQTDAGEIDAARAALEKAFAEYGLALWSDLPGLALQNTARQGKSVHPAFDRVWIVRAQDLSPAALALCALLAGEECLVCQAPDDASGIGSRLRQNRTPLEIVENAYGIWERPHAVEQETVVSARPRGATARVVWKSVAEEISGLAAYLRKLLRLNADLEPRDVCIVAPTARWAHACAQDLGKSGVRTTVLTNRGPLGANPRSCKVRDEFEAYLRLRCMANSCDRFTHSELESLGIDPFPRSDADQCETGLSGYSISREACRGLSAPYMAEVLARFPEPDPTRLLDDTLSYVLDPFFDTSPHTLHICTPEHIGHVRARVLVVSGLAEGFWRNRDAGKTARSLRPVIAASEMTLCSRPRSIEREELDAWGLESDRAVEWGQSSKAHLRPSPLFSILDTERRAPLVGEQLLSGRL